MSLFCLCTSFALFFDFILTFTFLAPIIYLSTPEKGDIKEAALLAPNGISTTNEKHEISPLSNVPAGFVAYSKFICSKYGRIAMIIAFIGLHTFAYCGIVTMKSTFEPSKAFPSDSPLANSMESVRYVLESLDFLYFLF